MGKVVEMNAPAPPRSAGVSRKTALVLGGGGFTGGVYEIGALRALDLLSVNRSVNDFDIYVGTSAGSLIAALAANGITPEQMMRVGQRPGADAVPRHRPRHAAAPELARVRAEGRSSCRCTLARRRAQRSARARLAVGRGPRARARPTRCRRASTRARASRSTCARCSPTADRTDDFRLLERELYLAATDLDTCERIVLGAEGWDDVPISAAVRASTALPMVYKPHRVKDRELVDGGIVSTTNLDIAVEAGAKFVVVVNPLVPYVNDFSKTIPTLFGTRVRGASRTWASRRSATRRSSCSPTSACTRWRASGRSATRASTSS